MNQKNIEERFSLIKILFTSSISEIIQAILVKLYTMMMK
jgi:hypothetical protein